MSTTQSSPAIQSMSTNSSNSPLGEAWGRLTQALRVAVSAKCLLMSLLGMFFMYLGSLCLGAASASTSVASIHFGQPVVEVVFGSRQDLPRDPVVGVPVAVAQPGWEIFGFEKSGKPWLLGFLSLVWNVCVWSLFGLAIARMAVVACGPSESISISTMEAFEFARRNWQNVAGAPLSVLLAIVLTAIPVHLVSWMVRFDVGYLLAGMFWIVALAFSALMAVLMLGLAIGWPLMWGAIAAEDSDLFDAISRSYAYAFQRPGHYLAYACMTVLLGMLGWTLACLTADAVIHLAFWNLQISGGHERMQLLRKIVEQPDSAVELTAMAQWGAYLVRHTNHLPWLLVEAFSFSFFWSSYAVIYLLLRRDVDQTAFDDVIGLRSLSVNGDDDLSS